MPYLNLRTNQEIKPEVIKEALSTLSTGIANILGKPESYIMISVEKCTPMLFAGTSDACAYVELKSLGLPESKTPLFSKALCELIEKEIGIKKERVYIEFSNPERHMWGWDSKTF